MINSDGTQVNESEIREFTNKKLGLDTSFETDIQGINEETIRIVLEGMRSVTSDEGGTAYQIFKDFPIEVGGKTGSAETLNDPAYLFPVGGVIHRRFFIHRPTGYGRYQISPSQ